MRDTVGTDLLSVRISVLRLLGGGRCGLPELELLFDILEVLVLHGTLLRRVDDELILVHLGELIDVWSVCEQDGRRGESAGLYVHFSRPIILRLTCAGILLLVLLEQVRNESLHGVSCWSSLGHEATRKGREEISLKTDPIRRRRKRARAWP